MNEHERRLLAALAEQQGHDNGPSLLRNLSSEAAEGNLPPFVGRFAETTRLLETANRRSKANALLVGPAGFGKTAIIENLARVIHQARTKLPQRFSKTRVFSLRILDLIADTGIVGALEKRIKTIFEKTLREGDIVFIDETHGLVGAATAQSSHNDAANILKPLLDRSGISLIGATTDAEYRHLETDQALRRRFSIIRVQPMSNAETRDVVKNACTSGVA